MDGDWELYSADVLAAKTVLVVVALMDVLMGAWWVVWMVDEMAAWWVDVKAFD